MRISVSFIAFIAAAVLLSSFASAAPGSVGVNECLKKIKASADQLDFPFVLPPNASFTPILREYLQLSPQANADTAIDVSHLVTFPTGQTQATNLEVDLRFRTDGMTRLNEVTIGQGRKPEFPFALSISKNRYGQRGSKIINDAIDQNFDVTTECRLLLSSTVITKTSVDLGVYNSFQQTFLGPTPTSGLPPQVWSREVPDNSSVYMFSGVSKTSELPDKIGTYVGKTNVVYPPSSSKSPFRPVTVVAISESLRDPIEDRQKNLIGSDFTYQSQGETVHSHYVRTTDSRTVVLESTGSAQWVVSKSIWSNVSIAQLNHSGDLSVKLASPADEVGALLQILMTTNLPLAYPNLKTYWNLTSVRSKNAYGPDGKIYAQYANYLTAMPDIEYANLRSDAPLTPNIPHEFLGSSTTVQTNDPIVQKIASEVAANYPTNRNRALLARAIAENLKNYMSYNYSDVEIGGAIQVNLTTSEILTTHSGTCHNFSVAFSAVARAMGIPTRIIYGLQLSNYSAGYHAWVEIETTEGVWIPLDPQVAQDVFPVSNYFPLAYETDDTFNSASLFPMIFPRSIRPEILKTRPNP